MQLLEHPQVGMKPRLWPRNGNFKTWYNFISKIRHNSQRSQGVIWKFL